MLNELDNCAFKPTFDHYREKLLALLENKVDRAFKFMLLNLK